MEFQTNLLCITFSLGVTIHVIITTNNNKFVTKETVPQTESHRKTEPMEVKRVSSFTFTSSCIRSVGSYRDFLLIHGRFEQKLEQLRVFKLEKNTLKLQRDLIVHHFSRFIVFDSLELKKPLL